MKQIVEDKSNKVCASNSFGVSRHRYVAELLRLARFVPYVGLKLYDLTLKPLNGLALLFDRNPIFALAILPFIGLPVIYILIFVTLPAFIKVAMTFLAFIVFALVRDRE